jgi:hypothetical protein
LFFVAAALRNGGEIPYPLNLLSEKQINLMHKSLKDMFDVLLLLDDECRVLWDLKHDFDSLLDACISGAVSVPAAACYAKKFRLEHLDIGIGYGLEKEQILNVFQVALRLEREWDFFKKYRLLVQRSLHRFDVE